MSLPRLRSFLRVSLTCLVPVISFGAAPIVTSISPESAAPGSIITLTGENFSATVADNRIRFGAVAVPASGAGAGTLSVTVPAGATMDRIAVSVPGQGTGWSPNPFVPVFAPAGTLSNRSFGEASAFFPPWITPPSYPSYGKLFTLATSSSGMTQGVVIADFDGDGRPDIAVAGSSSAKAYVFRNLYTAGELSAGAFGTPLVLTAGATPVELGVGDLNGDGKVDLVCANAGANTLTVWENTSVSGTISFATPVTISVPFELLPLSAVKLADVDRDGWLDIAFIGRAPAVMRNLGSGGGISTGSFAAAVAFSLPGDVGADFVLEDFDGDCRPDFLISGTNKITILRNQSTPGALGAASFAAAFSLTAPSTVQAVAAADLDGDHRPEILVGHLGGGVSIYRNQAVAGSLGVDSFAARLDILLPNTAYPLNMSVADLNGDGRIEYLVANPYTPGVLVGINRAGDSLSASLNIFTSLSVSAGDAALGSYGRVAVGDLNGDGRPDLVVDGNLNGIRVAPSYVEPLTAAALTIAPTSVRVTVPWRRYRTLSVTQIYNDGSSVDVTQAATLSSSQPTVAAINSAGLATGLTVGTTSIGASFDAFSTSASLAVDPIILGSYAGSPDGRFLPQIENNSARGVVAALVVQPDGRVIVGGRFATVNGVARRNLARLNDDGSLDTTFDPGQGPDGDIESLALDAQGRVLIVGRFATVNGTTRRAAARLLSDGSVDTSFNASFTAYSFLRANVVAVRADGRILIGGTGLETTGVSGISHLIQFDDTGARDSSFSAYALSSGEIETLLIQPDGKILMGGSFLGTTPSGLGLFCLSRLNPDGTRDTGFAHGITGSVVYALARQSDGKVVVGGDFSTVHGQAIKFITRFNGDGSLDTSFSAPTSSGWGIVKALSLAPDGKILVGKSTEPVRLTTTGALDATFSATVRPDWDIYAIHVMPDEKIWCAGGYTGVNGGVTLGIARLHGDVGSFAAWRSRYFSRAEIDADPAGTGPGGVRGEEGTPNLLRYASGLSPNEAAAQLFSRQSLVQEEAGAYFQLTYRRLRAARDLVYEVGISSDLVDWDYSGAEILPVGSPVISNDGLTEDVTVKVSIESPRVFLKQQVRVAP